MIRIKWENFSLTKIKFYEIGQVGDYVYYGRGTEENPSKAAYHYRIAAEHGGYGQGKF